MFKVSHSKVKTWRRCHYLYDLKYVRKLRRKYKGRPQTVGSIVHESLEALYTGNDVEAVFVGYEEQIGKMFVEERIEFGLDGAVAECREIYAGYVRYWKKDGLKYIAVELEFNENTRLEIAPGIIYIGKIDAVVSLPEARSDNDVWIFERKTCKRIPDERKRATDVQTVLYWAFLPMIRRKLGRRFLKEKWPTPKGVIWDYVRSKAPSVPHLNQPNKKTGVAEMSKRDCDTTWERYEQALLENGLDSFFRRIRLPFSAKLRDQVVKEFIETAQEMSIKHGKMKDRNLTFDCARCEFYNLCQAELHGLDIDLMLKKDYEVRTDEKLDQQETVIDE
jgi:hypothetical protein